MSVYIDDAHLEYRGQLYCHLMADTTDELHAFAARIGLQRSWFQPNTRRPEADHYDVNPRFRVAALNAGAIEETCEDGSLRRRALGRARINADCARKLP